MLQGSIARTKKQTKNPTLPKSIQLLTLSGERMSGYNEENSWETSGSEANDGSRQRTASVWAQGGALEPLEGFTQ